ncbi:hypothetical protein MB2181_05090 [Methylophilales bacterium HTCC2181]|uniref:Uncharacterized protein n=1 Tax=Methylophilales bacterium HTCC2181 TaxID=383631 RepID=A0P7B5_9PROT|nr:hypothetical protein MB2181_05090 [Methylophilales bacterium HTCC2181]
MKYKVKKNESNYFSWWIRDSNFRINTSEAETDD